MRSLQVRSHPPASSIHADTVARQLVESFNEVVGEESSVELIPSKGSRDMFTAI